MSTNRYGVDVSYFHVELARLMDSLPNRPAEELARYLMRLANVAAPPEVSQEAPASPAPSVDLDVGREPLSVEAAPLGDRIMRWRFRGSLSHDEFTEAMRLLRAIPGAPSGGEGSGGEGDGPSAPAGLREPKTAPQRIEMEDTAHLAQIQAIEHAARAHCEAMRGIPEPEADAEIFETLRNLEAALKARSAPEPKAKGPSLPSPSLPAPTETGIRCPECGGDGEYKGGETCFVCLGTVPPDTGAPPSHPESDGEKGGSHG